MHIYILSLAYYKFGRRYFSFDSLHSLIQYLCLVSRNDRLDINWTEIYRVDVSFVRHTSKLIEMPFYSVLSDFGLEVKNGSVQRIQSEADQSPGVDL